MNPVAETNAEMLRLSRQLDERLGELVTWSKKYAQAERDYRKSKAIAYRALQEKKLTVPEKEAEVDAATADERYERDLAESMKQASIEAVRNARGQLSATQSMANVQKEELRLSLAGVS